MLPFAVDLLHNEWGVLDISCKKWLQNILANATHTYYWNIHHILFFKLLYNILCSFLCLIFLLAPFSVQITFSYSSPSLFIFFSAFITISLSPVLHWMLIFHLFLFGLQHSQPWPFFHLCWHFHSSGFRDKRHRLQVWLLSNLLSAGNKVWPGTTHYPAIVHISLTPTSPTLIVSISLPLFLVN